MYKDDLLPGNYNNVKILKKKTARRIRLIRVGGGLYMPEKNLHIDSLELRKQYEKLRESAAKDSLTGLLNRGTAEKYIKRHIMTMKPGEACAMLIVDLDNFKQVNDKLGHRMGDEVLKQTGKILSGIFRATDIIGRLGGDEFVIFLRGNITDMLLLKKGGSICENVQIYMDDESGILVTASVGICMSKNPERNFDNMYHIADEALYDSKRNGKNRFCIKMDNSEYVFEEPLTPLTKAVKLTKIMEYVDSGVILLDCNNPEKSLYVSPNMKKMVGADSKYASSLVIKGLIHRDDHLIFDRMVKKANEGEELNQSLRIRNNNGKFVWCRVRMTKIEYDTDSNALMMAVTDISELKESEQSLKEDNERLRSAVEQSGRTIWEVNISSEKIIIYDYKSGDDNKEKHWIDFPEGLLENGYVHSDSTVALRTFANDLYNGKASGYGNFLVMYIRSGNYGWATFSYRTVFDANGKAVRAVGTIERLGDGEQSSQPRIDNSQMIPKALLSYMVVNLKIDLTKSRVDEAWVEGKNLKGATGWKTYEDILERARDNIFNKEDLEGFYSIFSRDALLKAYEKHELWKVKEYRRISVSGEVMRVMFVGKLSRDKVTGDIIMYVFLRNIDKKYQWELKLNKTASRDKRTGIYDRDAVKAMTEYHMKKDKPFGVALIHIAGLSRMFFNDQEMLNDYRFYMATAFRVALEPTCIIGQFDKENIIAFFPDVVSEEHMHTTLQEAFRCIRKILLDTMEMDELRFLAGAVFEQKAESEYESLLNVAIRLCDRWWNAAGDKVAFPEKSEDWRWRELKKVSESDRMCTLLNESNRPLRENEKDIIIKCITAMLMSDTLEYSMQIVLESLGEFYKADRTYVLRLVENGSIVNMPCEWTAAEKHSIRDVLSGQPVKRLPLLQRCMDEKAPIFLSRKVPADVLGQSPWHFTILPMSEGGHVTSFICVENAKKNHTEIALVSSLLPYILRERQRYHKAPRFSASFRKQPLGVYEDLPNLKAYLSVIHGYNSERYISMGAVCVDIPNFAGLNSSYGFEYGTKLLWYIANTLENIFGSNNLFRTWDSEFTVLCGDVIQPIFAERCKRLRKALDSRYRGKIRAGYTWSSGVFSGKELVEEAKELMQANLDAGKTNNMYKAMQKIARMEVADAMIADRNFVVFVQPKINMHTGELLGGEALVRGVTEKGSLVPPMQFIEEFEASGDIRALDLFVLDKTMSLISKWKEQGMEPPPISVNFSRVTLFDPTVVASVLAIQSRYPEVDPSYVEIEITETSGNISPDTLRERLEMFSQFGVKFAMDDFGSQYSNLSIFVNVKFDTVKLDRSLVADIVANNMSREMVRNILKLCETHDMKCVAEGVETKEQIELLKEIGCVCAQGYYYDRPIPADEFRVKYLRTNESTLKDKVVAAKAKAESNSNKEKKEKGEA